MKKCYFFWILTSLLSWMTACQSDKTDDPVVVNLTITPTDSILLVKPNDTLRFTTNTQATWQVTGGAITINGIYKAPTTAGIYQLWAVNANNSLDTVFRKIIVTPQAELFKAMQQGGYILYFRHMTANTGADTFGSFESQWWRSSDPSIARQLSPAGQVQAQETGSAMRNLKLRVEKIFSSEFKRCLESVQFMNLGAPVETSTDLTYYVYNENQRYLKTIQLAERQPVSNGIIILMAHAFTTGDPGAPNLQMGDAAVYKQLPGNKIDLRQIDYQHIKKFQRPAQIPNIISISYWRFILIWL
ncbi:MAG: hypothetical protein ACK4TA_26115 [Saprospiraceae bacterium]